MQGRGDWEGLQCGLADCDGWARHDALSLDRSVLLLHRLGGRRFAVRQRGAAWKFVARPGRFDYYPAGHYDEVASGPLAMDAIRVDIPVAFESSVLEEGHWAREMTPRFQFQDRRLEALVLAMTRGAATRSAPPEAVMLSVAVVDRLYETTEAGGHPPRSVRFTGTVQRLIADYLDQHVASPVAVEQVAALTGLARTQFAKLFRESFGEPLHRYVIARKIELATRRLLEDVLVTDLSQELGFASHAHFSTVFRSHVGATPSEYRRRHLPQPGPGKACLQA